MKSIDYFRKSFILKDKMGAEYSFLYFGLKSMITYISNANKMQFCIVKHSNQNKLPNMFC